MNLNKRLSHQAKAISVEIAVQVSRVRMTPSAGDDKYYTNTDILGGQDIALRSKSKLEGIKKHFWNLKFNLRKGGGQESTLTYISSIFKNEAHIWKELRTVEAKVSKQVYHKPPKQLF